MARKTQKSLLNFNSGIWSTKLDGRIDLEKYSYACRQLENFLIRPYGMIERRPGSKYINNTKNNGFAVVWEFQYSSEVGYVIEAGENYLRFYDGYSRVAGDANTVTAISWAVGGVVTYTTGTNHVLGVDDDVTVSGLVPTGYNISGRVLSIPAANQFTLQGPVA